ncbi:MAG: DUF3253 domain-containing protein [Planctomycetes bacterium]|nr:DUF3253 domain-containing protein [Planctomycetota bacterium]
MRVDEMVKTRWLEHEEPTNSDVRDEILRLLMMLKSGESICPSEAARAFGPKWRQYMPLVREVASDMARDELIEVTQQGTIIDVDERELESIKGPVRLRLAKRKESNG